MTTPEPTESTRPTPSPVRRESSTAAASDTAHLDTALTPIYERLLAERAERTPDTCGTSRTPGTEPTAPDTPDEELSDGSPGRPPRG